jgi:hypothetical protein
MPTQYINNFGSKLWQFASATDLGVLGNDAAGNITRIYSATAGHILTCNGAGLAPSFQAPAASSVTIAGDVGTTTGNSFTFAGGTSGAVFTMAAGTMTESFNFLALPITSSVNGQIKINNVVALQMYGLGNTFVGGAGNLTTTTQLTTAVGGASCQAITSGVSNTAIGSNSMKAITSSQYNVAAGDRALYAINTGNGGNTACGSTSLNNTASGVFLTGIGFAAGTAYTTNETNNICLGANVSGTVGESNVTRIGNGITKAFIAGITGVTPDTAGALVNITDSAGQLGTLGAMASGQMIIGSTGANPSIATITSTGGSILVTAGAGTLNLDVVSGGIPWNDNIATPVTLVVNQAFAANRAAGVVAYTLPATALFGQLIRISGVQNGWTVAQAANQVIHFGNLSTTIGVGGSLASTHRRDTIEMVCVVAGASTEWNILSAIGNITVV